MAALHRLAPILLPGLLLAAPLATDAYLQYVLNLVLVYAIIGIGLNILLGYTGQFAFAHAAFMGIGAYAAAILTTRVGLSYWLSLPLAGLICVLIGVAMAFPAMRLKRVYLALATLAFAELTTWVLIHWKTVTLGTDGIELKSPDLFGWRIKGDHRIYYVILTVGVLLYWLADRLIRSKVGRAFVAVRESEIVAACNGIDVRQIKIIAFGLSAFYAGIGGALFALALGFIVPDAFGVNQVGLHFSIVVIGGLASLPGSLIGAVLVTILPEALRGLQGLQEIVYGITLVVVVIFMPDGIAGILRRFGILPRETLAARPASNPSSSRGAGLTARAEAPR